jgi:hypothetical protein
VSHTRRAVLCATRTCHTHFHMGKLRDLSLVTCDERCVRVRREITASFLLYRVNVLPFLRIESTQLKW